MDSTIGELVFLFRSSHPNRPLLLLGAGASYRAGIPLASDAVKKIAQASYAKRVKGMDWRICNVALSDSHKYLQEQPWFISDPNRLGENFPLAVDHLLTPREFRRTFLLEMIRRPNRINDGYKHLANIMLRKLCWTVLTTNFDRLIVEALQEHHAHIREIVEVNRTLDDLVQFNIYNRCQVIYLHGVAESYRDRNLAHEIENLDEKLVELLRPLLNASPLIVIGYRGSELSIMRHLLEEGIDASMMYKHGIYWCIRQGEELHENVRRLRERIGTNFRLIEIKGFDELLEGLDRELEGESWYSGADTPFFNSSVSEDEQAFDRRIMESSTIDDLDHDLILTTLVSYCQWLKLSPVNQQNYLPLMREQGLLIDCNGTLTPTVGCYLLFGKSVTDHFPYARISLIRDRKKQLIFDGNLLTQFRKLIDYLTSEEVNPILEVKKERTSEEMPAYPPRALVELAVNMLVHRDYSVPDYSRIEFEPGQHLRFTNPGGLMPSVYKQVQITIKKDGKFQPVRGASQVRNDLLADIFFGIRSMNKQGTGLPDVKEWMVENAGRAEFAIGGENQSVSFTLLQALQAKPGKSRLARQLSQTEKYITNLLPFQVTPQRVYVLPLRETPLAHMPLFEPGESPHDLPLFIKHANNMISFADLKLYPDFAERHGYLERIGDPKVDEYIQNPDQRRLFVWLLGKHWSFFLQKWKQAGLCVDDYKNKRAFFHLTNGERNTIIYDSTKRKHVKRDVVKRREYGNSLEHENEGISYSVVEYGGQWAIQIKPTYIFTGSDGCTPLPPSMQARRATRRFKFDRNKNVDDDLTFWARYLSEGKSTIGLGNVGVTDLILGSEYCSVEVPISNRERNTDENAN